VQRIRLLVVAGLVAALSMIGLSNASAAGPRTPEIKSLGAYAQLDDHNRSEVEVRGTYRCWGPSDEMHLWVSVKQGGPDPTLEGSSATVKAWYDTNVSQDVRVKCDGKWHTRTVELGRQKLANYPDDPPNTAPSRKLGYLKEGKGWLQFCLVPPSPTGDIFASKSRWVTVVDDDD
jgi:hypothetical protein